MEKYYDEYAGIEIKANKKKIKCCKCKRKFSTADIDKPWGISGDTKVCISVDNCLDRQGKTNTQPLENDVTNYI